MLILLICLNEDQISSGCNLNNLDQGKHNTDFEKAFDKVSHHGLIIIIIINQYIYKQRQSHAMSQRRWLATAVIFRPSDVSLGFAET